MDRRLAARTLCRSLLGGLALAATVAGAGDESRWLYLGDTAATPTWPSGQLSIDLASLRQRGLRHEIWERTLYLPDPSLHWTWLPTDGPPERRTLWSIRCSRSAMAILTRGLAGSFEPRNEKPRYYVPAPGSADAAVLAATCHQVKQLTPVAERPPEAPLPEDRDAAWRVLERPPVVLVDGDDDEED